MTAWTYIVMRRVYIGGLSKSFRQYSQSESQKLDGCYFLDITCAYAPSERTQHYYTRVIHIIKPILFNVTLNKQCRHC